MARGVLGNDPFKRGAAVRPAEEQPEAEAPAEAAVLAGKKKKGASAAGAKKPAKQQPKSRAPKAAAARAKEQPRPAPAPVAKRTEETRAEQLASQQPAAGKIAQRIEEPAPPAQPAARAEQRPAAAERADRIERPEPSKQPAARAERLEPAAPQPVPDTEEPAGFESTLPFGRPLPEPKPAATTAAPNEGSVETVAPDELGAISEEVPLAEEVEDAGPVPHLSATMGRRAMGAIVRGRDLISAASSSGILSSLFEGATGVVRAVQSALGTAGAANLDDYGKDPSLAQELEPLARFAYESWWRIKVEGAEHVPAGPSLLVANHSGAMPIDGPVLHAALSRARGDLPEARWLVEDQVFYAPFVGVLLNRLGAVRACPENAIRLLDEGRPVIVFPEGLQGISKRFSHRYQLARFGRGGFAKIALRSRVPIVPVAIVGAEETLPMLARLPGKAFGVPYVPITTPIPLPARWTIRFGEPIRVDSFSPEAADDLVLVHQLTDKTREAVQGMLDALLKARPGVFA